ncbi:hypothetical protein [Pedobacter sp. NJ-S-72]
MIKTYIISFCILCLFNTTKAQSSKVETEFMTWYLTKRQDKTEKQTAYIDSYRQYESQELKTTLKADTIFDQQLSSYQKGSIRFAILTEEDKKIINEQLEESKIQNIPRKLLRHHSAIKRKTIDLLFLNRSNGWGPLHKMGIHRYYSFKKPIFFRNNTLCIFEEEYHCFDLCGNGTTYIYKKENGEWKACMDINRRMDELIQT